jgi:hypothetical protein
MVITSAAARKKTALKAAPTSREIEDRLVVNC